MLQNHHLLLHIGIDTDTFPDERHYRFDDIHLEKIDICQFLWHKYNVPVTSAASISVFPLRTDLVCIQCQTVFTLPEKYLDRPSTHITGKDLFLLCKITNLLIYSDIKQHQCMLKYVKRQSYKIAIARF